MRTTRNPDARKVGLNLANSLFVSTSKDNLDVLNIFFKKKEREVAGRRILIAIYILEDYSMIEIVQKLHCGKSTYTSIKKELDLFLDNENSNKKSLLIYLKKYSLSNLIGKRL